MKADKKVTLCVAPLQGTSAVSHAPLTEYQRGKRDFAEHLQSYLRDEFESRQIPSTLRSISQLLEFGGDREKLLDGSTAYGLSRFLDECAEDLECERRRHNELLYQAVNGKPSEREQRRLKALERKRARRKRAEGAASPAKPYARSRANRGGKSTQRRKSVSALPGQDVESDPAVSGKKNHV